jgi:hypothetical protein
LSALQSLRAPELPGLLTRRQLYADSPNGVPMKILDTFPVKLAVFELNPSTLEARQRISLVACLIHFGDNYTSFLRHGPLEFKKPV